MHFGRPVSTSLSPTGGPNRGRAPRILAALIAGSLCLGKAQGTAEAADAGQASTTAAAPTPAVATAPPFVFPADDRDLLALDDEMRAFFAARIDADATKETRLNQIIDALLGPQGLHLTYVTDANTSARETFRQRRGNCMSFSLLAVALARAYGLTARFGEVDTYPRWDRFGNVVTEIRHLNVQVSTGAVRHELELLPDVDRRASVASVRLVSDARAFAHFYNNLGVFRVADGALPEALRLFDRALAADPTAAFVWANKGSALSLVGDLAAAQTCLERAVREGPKDAAALSSLAGLYTRTGRRQEAAALNKKAQRYQMRNPYYLSLLARSEMSRGQYLDAEKHLRRAIAIKGDEPEFYELRILVANSLGRTDDARRWDARLEALRATRVQPVPTP